MDATVAQRLIALNKEFYQSLAAPFSATRGRVQPGVSRVLDRIPMDASILDLGCGNGSVAAELAKRGFQGSYTGLDFSEELLKVARTKAGKENFTFAQADLTDLSQHPAIGPQQFDRVLCFATLHHIPSTELRLEFLRSVAKLISDRGQFTVSNWLFLNSPKLNARIQPWEAAGLAAADVDPGDYLLDWRSGEQRLRYLHAFTEDELAGLAEDAGFMIIDSFLSDGHGGNLSLYQTWTKKN